MIVVVVDNATSDQTGYYTIDMTSSAQPGKRYLREADCKNYRRTITIITQGLTETNIQTRINSTPVLYFSE